jgi:UDP-GlcNAc:undecaprenyl-phosphate/decaprenyl-phosphate GlcNAc-1-phosphate transferase
MNYFLAWLFSLLACTLLTPFVRQLALRFGAVSMPGGRHVHARSIPRLGGLAITFGFCAPLLVMRWLHPGLKGAFVGHEGQLLGVVGGGVFLCAVGAFDDLRGVRAQYKLLAQVAAGILAFTLGFRIQAVFLPFIGTLDMGVFALPVTLLWIVGITNAVNLIDGLDGLAAGVAFFAAFTSFVVAYVSGSTLVALLMASLMGTLIGFLFFNFNPARIFMGDSGSYFLGYLLATTSLAGHTQQKASTAVSLLVPILALGVPIFDTLFSMVRRMLERRPLFAPDRGHVHHRLLDLGMTHRRAVMVLYGVSVLLAAGAIAVSLGRAWEVGVALFSVSVVFVALVRFLGYFEYLHARGRQTARIYDSQTELLRRAVPLALLRLEQASRDDEVFDTVWSTLSSAGFASIRLVGSDPPASWVNPVSESPGRVVGRATFPVGPENGARASLQFEWLSEQDDHSPQRHILLQLLADGVTRALTRVGSSLAPQPISDAEEVLDSSALAAPTSL